MARRSPRLAGVGGQFDAGDLGTLLVELRTALAMGEDTTGLVAAWRLTAEALADPDPFLSS